jgi:hypothetical protein
MKEWGGKCQRCCGESNTHVMSMFNEDLICEECKESERNHPQYKRACIEEIKAIMNGNMNYKGMFANVKFEN